ncbi:MAG: 3D domain-containing protein [Armatimonas sp.]
MKRLLLAGALLLLSGLSAQAQTVRTLYDFERGFEGWRLSGECWGRGPEDATYAFGRFSGWRGARYASTAHANRNGNPDTGTGKAVSETFTIDGERIQFFIGGGRNDGTCELRLIVDGQAVRTQSGNNSDKLEQTFWDVTEFLGKDAHFELVDERRSGPRGYLLVDQIEIVTKEALIPPPNIEPVEPTDTRPNRPLMVVEGKLPLPTGSSLTGDPGFFDSPLSVFLPDGKPANAKRCIVLEATGYSPDPSENGGYTVTTRGTPLGRGIAAVDPKLIPLGSKLWIEGYGYALADDIGSAIKGKRIDLCHATLVEGNAYGRKKVKVWILETPATGANPPGSGQLGGPAR